MLLPASLILVAPLLLLVSLLCWWYCCCFHYCLCLRSCCCGSHAIVSSLLLLVAGVTAVACIPTVGGFAAIAGNPLVPDVLSVAGLDKSAPTYLSVFRRRFRPIKKSRVSLKTPCPLHCFCWRPWFCWRLCGCFRPYCCLHSCCCWRPLCWSWRPLIAEAIRYEREISNAWR